jgi:hypothetical protein
MRRGSVLTLCLMALIILLSSNLFAQDNTENLQSRIIERFDDPAGTDLYGVRQNFRWIVRGSKFITDGFPQFAWVETYPDALYNRNNPVPPGVTPRALGVEAAFDRPGYNYLEFIPVEDEPDEDGEPVPTGIPIPGIVKNLDFWVWGSNFEYYVEIHLQDYRGISHVLYVDDINYRGWRNLTVNIPSAIPQTVEYVPSRKGLELVKIVLWTTPGENVSGFYVYLDQIKVFTDVFLQPFDGEVLSDPEEVDNLWNQGVN